ncbi:MAG: NAD(P)H-dependent oxidoreductase [Treponema sp.]|jgi:flavodoxin|nr:NAD(P)H-dependent oxidoreductase [Treponema sp.]MDR1250747.1 NAD(P)H-dependent oxidoreductase [Treponema sp.]
MKKILLLVLSFFSMGIQINLDAQNQSETGRILVAYFSQTGNTRGIARQVHQKLGGDRISTNVDIFEIECLSPYPENHDALFEQARTEQQQQVRPTLKTHVANMAQYDIVFLGFPIWWSSLPMAVISFLEEYDFSGKTILPFCSSGSGSSGQSRSVIVELASHSTVAETFAVRTSGGPSLSNDISAWLRRNRIAER